MIFLIERHSPMTPPLKPFLLTALTFTFVLIISSPYINNVFFPNLYGNSLTITFALIISAYITSFLLSGPIAIPATLTLYSHPYISVFLLVISTIPCPMILVSFWENKDINFIFRILGVFAWLSFGIGQLAYILAQINM